MLAEKMLAHCAERVRIERQKASNTSDFTMRNVALTHADTVELIASELREIVEAEVLQAQEPCPKCTQGKENLRKLSSEFEKLSIECDSLRQKSDDTYSDASGIIQRMMKERDALQAKVAEQAALIEKCEKGLAAVESLIDESSGVVGLHLNGDIAPWASIRAGGFFELWLELFDEAVAAITAQKGDK